MMKGTGRDCCRGGSSGTLFVAKGEKKKKKKQDVNGVTQTSIHNSDHRQVKRGFIIVLVHFLASGIPLA